VAIKCNDDHEFQNPESSARAASAHPLLSEWTLDRERALPCAHWPVAAIPAAERGRVASAIPTLLLVGAFDPATPSSYAEFAAATLARAHVLEFPASGHGLLGSDRCVSAIIEDFLDDPKTRPAAACLHAMRPVDFSPSIQMHAVALLAQGEPTEAEELLRQTLARQQEGLRPDDRGIAVTLSVLGELYHGQARLTDAEDALVRALAINGKAYGPDSLEAGKSAGRLALVYHDQGKTGQAASLYRRTLRILEREHGQNHADVSFYRSRYGELVSRSGAARP
jgi:tetratricopeptide (TPR) repeat protein